MVRLSAKVGRGMAVYPGWTTTIYRRDTTRQSSPCQQPRPATSQMMRVSAATPMTGQVHNIFGWGVSAGRFNATSAGNRLTCVGDSGGPSTRYISGYYVATGTHRGPDDLRCANPGETMFGSDPASKASWIESTLRGAYGAAFSCSRSGAGADAYMKCF